jgi:hypothetical protein
MVVSPAGLGTKNDCAGEDQQQFTRPDSGGYEALCHLCVKPCSPLKVNRTFGGTRRLLLLLLVRISCVGEPMGIAKLSSRSYWFILSYGRANGNLLVVLHFPPISYVNRNFGKQLCLLATCFTLVSYLAYYSTLKMEAICSSEASVEFQRITRRYIPEDRTLNLCLFLRRNSVFKVLLCTNWTTALGVALYSTALKHWSCHTAASPSVPSSLFLPCGAGIISTRPDAAVQTTTEIYIIVPSPSAALPTPPKQNFQFTLECLHPTPGTPTLTTPCGKQRLTYVQTQNVDVPIS